jgi:hypothetical protein
VNQRESKTQEGSKRFLWSFFSLFVLLSYPLLANSSNPFKYNQVAMGTAIEITLVGDNEEKATKALQAGDQRIKHSHGLIRVMLLELTDLPGSNGLRFPQKPPR